MGTEAMTQKIAEYFTDAEAEFNETFIDTSDLDELW